MLLVWHTLRQKSRGSGQLIDRHVVRVFYSITDFTMLNPVNLSRFVTLTLWHFVTPQERTHWLAVDCECAIFESNFVRRLFSLGSSS